jgi:hypothetical protein
LGGSDFCQIFCCFACVCVDFPGKITLWVAALAQITPDGRRQPGVKRAAFPAASFVHSCEHSGAAQGLA